MHFASLTKIARDESNYIRPYQKVWNYLFGRKPTTYGLKDRKWSSISGITR